MSTQKLSTQALQRRAIKVVREALNVLNGGGDVTVLRMAARQATTDLSVVQGVELVAVFAHMVASLVSWLPEDKREQMLTELER